MTLNDLQGQLPIASLF